MRNLSPLVAPVDDTAHQSFLEDMQDFFGGWRVGHIARHGYVGKGGEFYSQWLSKNDTYRSRVTLAEVELIYSHVETIRNICSEASHFVEVGAGSFNSFLMKTHALLAALVANKPQMRYSILDVSRAAFESVASNVKKLGMPKPDFFEGNFFSELPLLEKHGVVYMSGLTFTNIPEDAIKGDTQQIIEDTLSFFARSLKKGGAFIFSYATADGINADGAELKQFYDDPLIHAYQKSIFERVENELVPEGTFDADAFQIHHAWHPEKAVLTRHATITKPMRFNLGDQTFDLRPETFDGYMANNFRLSDEHVIRAAKKTRASDIRIFSLPRSNVRLAVVTYNSSANISHIR